ncbi:hypothetical protein BTN49_2419 [Candidatus Enterovibrio escicola]|uniref:Uncharacterized protein n=1 Tax=Candidatus Enterovibrio escicola TaxID=1927127 RepID=A0A2A5T1C3_9GAMM|nr:hypothetical protein [Candidatus Enterovibrio escacola]PCS21954.1 hypothetical protein BTN49_2419 [Candidatus Enterovibrio escacola]
MAKLRSDRLKKNYYLHKDLGLNNSDAVFVDVDNFCHTFLPA